MTMLSTSFGDEKRDLKNDPFSKINYKRGIDMGFGKRLEKILKEHNSNPNDIADRIGVPAATIYSIIRRDSSNVSVDLLLKISNELDIDPYDFADTQDFKSHKKTPYPEIRRKKINPFLDELTDYEFDLLCHYVQYLFWRRDN